MKRLLCCAVFLTACIAQTAAPSPAANQTAGKLKIMWQKLEASIQR